MSESLVGLIDPQTRHAAVSIGGVGPGGSKAPAGTTAAIVIVVSGRTRLARLSHDAGAACAGDPSAPASAKLRTEIFNFMVASLRATVGRCPRCAVVLKTIVGLSPASPPVPIARRGIPARPGGE